MNYKTKPDFSVRSHAPTLNSAAQKKKLSEVFSHSPLQIYEKIAFSHTLQELCKNILPVIDYYPLFQEYHPEILISISSAFREKAEEFLTGTETPTLSTQEAKNGLIFSFLLNSYDYLGESFLKFLHNDSLTPFFILDIIKKVGSKVTFPSSFMNFLSRGDPRVFSSRELEQFILSFQNSPISRRFGKKLMTSLTVLSSTPTFSGGLLANCLYGMQFHEWDQYDIDLIVSILRKTPLSCLDVIKILQVFVDSARGMDIVDAIVMKPIFDTNVSYYKMVYACINIITFLSQKNLSTGTLRQLHQEAEYILSHTPLRTHASFYEVQFSQVLTDTYPEREFYNNYLIDGIECDFFLPASHRGKKFSEKGVIIELDGAHHTLLKNARFDKIKQTYLELHGYHVQRFSSIKDASSWITKNLHNQ